MRFERQPKARASLRSGMLYAIDSGAGHIYYAQVSPFPSTFGFFRFRSSELATSLEVLCHPIMCRVVLFNDSIGRALREGYWLKMGRCEAHPSLKEPFVSVMCPVGSIQVEVWKDELGEDGEVVSGKWYETTIDDPRIQDCEQMAVWDAIHHMPERLKADFGQETADWHVGGPIRRARRVKEEWARRFPDRPGTGLPPNWVRSDQ